MNASSTFHSSGVLFKKSTLGILTLAVFWASWSGQSGVLALTGLVLAAAVFTRVWVKLCLKKVECSRVLNKNRLFPGDNLEIRLEISNRKLLPLPWIQIDEEVPLSMTQKHFLEPCNRPGFGLSRSITALLGYSKAYWAYPLTCRRRGFYQLGSLKLTSGDLFGFYSQTRQLATNDAIIVYPDIYRIEGNYFPSYSPLGESKADKNIYHDPSRIIGLRDYSYSDSLRHVHWKATARRQQLQVKVFESTVTIKTALFLSVDSFQAKPDSAEDFELAISTAASIAKKLVERKSHVGLYANTSQIGSGHQVSLKPESNPKHLMNILETLAKCEAVTNESFKDLIVAKQVTFDRGSTLVLIMTDSTKDIQDYLLSLKAAGYKIIIMFIGKIKNYTPQPGLLHYQVVLHKESSKLYFKKIAS